MAAGTQTDADGAELDNLLVCVDIVCDAEADTAAWARRMQAIRHLCTNTHPKTLRHEERRKFVQRAREKGLIEAVVRVIESGSVDQVCTASNFLGDLIFNEDACSREVLDLFDRIACRFVGVFEHALEDLVLLEAAMLLCGNLAAACPSGHSRLLPMVQPVCLQIIGKLSVSDDLRVRTITLLANLSMTTAPALRALGVGTALLDLVSVNPSRESGKSVAESVIIYLHGDAKCQEVDTLVAMDVIPDYCVRLLRSTLAGEEFRDMYPHLLYSVRVFQVLAQCREYAQLLAGDPNIVPLLLHATCAPMRVETDLDGRRLALEALRSLSRFRLWPSGRAQEGGDGCAAEDDDGCTAAFVERGLPELLASDSAGIRRSAAGLWASLNPSHVPMLLLVGCRLKATSGVPSSVWRCVLECLFALADA